MQPATQQSTYRHWAFVDANDHAAAAEAELPQSERESDRRGRRIRRVVVVVVSVGLGLWFVGAALVGCVGVSDWSVSVFGWVRIGGSITVRLAALQASSKRFLGTEVVAYEHPSSDTERRESRDAGGAIQTGRRREESGTGQIAGNCDDPGWMVLLLLEPSAEALDRMLAHAPSMPRTVG